MAIATFEHTPKAANGNRVQVKNPVTDRWVKLDTTKGRIVDTKKSPGPYKAIPKKQMALLFSPVDQSELVGPFQPRPRTAFLMLQLGGELSDTDCLLADEVRAALTERRFAAVTAADVRGTGDFLQDS